MKITKRTHINAPVATVFSWLEDNDRLRQWIPNLIEDEALIETPERVGSRFRQVYLENGKRMEMTGEITEFVENERMRVDITGNMFDLDVEYTVLAITDSKTELTQNTEIQFKGIMRLFAPIMSLMSKFSSQDPQAEAHEKLKTMAEAEYQAGI
ncbi:MAG: hypothetical protein HKN14_11125 [Marinicaulis sp.]|nr:hypothetical protein [Marinicaulis sp.]